MRFGTQVVPATVIEDLGPIGRDRRVVLRVRVDAEYVGEDVEYMVALEELVEPAPA